MLVRVFDPRYPTPQWVEAEFAECENCSNKPGSPALCHGCIRNREVITALLAKLNGVDYTPVSR